jgi:periplasmic divalent cation tolerance protein
MIMSDLLLVYSTFPTQERAAETGAALVEARLAACVTLLPGVASIYRWQGAIERETECLALIKTSRETWPALEARLRELHPYEVPEIVAVEAEAVSPAYAAWVAESTGPISKAGE